jgi:hypothetical protein
MATAQDASEASESPRLLPNLQGLLDEFSKSPRNAARKHLRRLGLCLALGLLISIPIAAGHISVLGARSAWGLYGRDWLTILLVVTPFFHALVLFVIVVEVVVQLPLLLLLSLLARMPRTVKYVCICLLGLGVVGLLAWTMYTGSRGVAAEALEPRPTASGTKEDAIRGAIKDQDQAAIKLSESANKLLAELDTTAANLQAAKENVRATLALAQQQRIRISAADGKAERLLIEEKLLQTRNNHLRDLLDGQQPVTVGTSISPGSGGTS